MSMNEDFFIWIQPWPWNRPQPTLTLSTTLKSNSDAEPRQIWNAAPKVAFVYPGTYMTLAVVMVPFVRVWVHAHFCSKHTPTLTLRFTFATNRHNLVQREIILAQVYDLLQCKTVGVNFTLSEPLSNEALLICLDLHASPILLLLAALALSASKTILVLALKVMFFKNLQYRARCGCSVFGKVRRQEFLRSTQIIVSAETSSNNYLWGFFHIVLVNFPNTNSPTNWSLSKQLVISWLPAKCILTMSGNYDRYLWGVRTVSTINTVESLWFNNSLGLFGNYHQHLAGQNRGRKNMSMLLQLQWHESHSYANYMKNVIHEYPYIHTRTRQTFRSNAMIERKNILQT